MTYDLNHEGGRFGIGKLVRYWQRLDLKSQFLVVAALILLGSMAILGEWLSSQIAANQLRSRAESGALYMEGFLARHVDEENGRPLVVPEKQKELDDLLIGTDLAKRVEGFRIWDKDGTVVYTTDKSLMGKRLPSEDIERAFAGTVVAQLEEHHDDQGIANEQTARPLIEIYAPIYRPGNHDVIAVGELYEEAEDFIAQRSRVQRSTWALVGATTLTIMGLLYLIVRRASGIINTQRETLKSQLENAQALADQNRALRRTADKARMDASKSNETLLNRIGSDLHDGPVQVLSLLILRLGQTSGAGNQRDELDPSRLASQVLSELRELSTGLVLPELENLSIEAALKLAAQRHEYATGSIVAAHYENLPEKVAHPLKICLYRVVQEGLNNAYRHAGARGQRVEVSADGSVITVTVSDKGPSPDQPIASAGRRHPLGLQGIRNRVEAFGGTVRIVHEPGAGTSLIVAVPLESNSA